MTKLERSSEMEKVVELKVEERTSKAGRPYYMLVITFKNGYVFETILNREQAYIITSLK